jgi:PhoD-like phosphatase/Secretion system C-terminal sorting domain/PhoD-like phosphatase, N-terminal domain
MKRYTCILAVIWAAIPIQAQIVTHGPMVGGVTDHAVRIYCRTDMPAAITIEISKDTSFTNIQSFNNQTYAGDYNTAITDITGLDAYTNYYYRIKTGSANSTINKFRTFPAKGTVGHYKVIVGSCNYNPGFGGGHGNPFWKNDSMFKAMADWDPDIFIHLGDWGFAPSALGWQHNFDTLLGAESFAIRSSDYNMKTYILPNMPVDYIYDDDYNQNGNAGWTWPVVTTTTLPNGQTKYVLDDYDLPPGLQRGANKNYFKYFPGYPQEDTLGIYHSFPLGNIDFIITDTRGLKSPVHEPFKYQSAGNTYKFQPDSNHSTLGTKQRLWLKDQLKNSTADWKIMGSSVLFNKKFGDFMNLVLLASAFSPSLVNYAGSIAYMWPGYPKDQNEILSFIRNENIKNVAVISGDTHSSMVDDGRNAGLPELSASGLSSGNEGFMHQWIDSVIQLVGLPVTTRDFLWNGGGTGVGNYNFSDSYGTLEIFGKDSMQLCVKDELLQTLGCVTLKYKKTALDSVPTSVTYNAYRDEAFTMIFPNPAKDQVRVVLNPQKIQGTCSYFLTDIQGKQVKPAVSISRIQDQFDLDLMDIAPGVYLLNLENEGQLYSRKLVISY